MGDNTVVITEEQVRALLRAEVPHSVVQHANDPTLYRQCVVLLTNVQYKNAPHFNDALAAAQQRVVDEIVENTTPKEKEPEPELDAEAEAEAGGEEGVLRDLLLL